MARASDSLPSLPGKQIFAAQLPADQPLPGATDTAIGSGSFTIPDSGIYLLTTNFHFGLLADAMFPPTSITYRLKGQTSAGPVVTLMTVTQTRGLPGAGGVLAIGAPLAGVLGFIRATGIATWVVSIEPDQPMTLLAGTSWGYMELQRQTDA